MSRTVLAAVALIGLAACGGGRERSTAKSTQPGVTRSTTGQPATSTQKKKGTKPDTSGAKNPLTNH